MAQNILRWVSDTVDTFKDKAKDTIDGHLPNGTAVDPNRKPKDIKPLRYIGEECVFSNVCLEGESNGTG